jgi:3-phenylpropionate/trans-cinnamate dioxygenase ferredoxin subunit
VRGACRTTLIRNAFYRQVFFQFGGEPVEYVTVARAGDIPDGEGRAFEVNDVAVGVFNCGGEFLAVGDVCTHAEALLHEGTLDRVRCTIECPLHGAEFDLRTGKVLTPPAAAPIQTFSVRLMGDEIQVAARPRE